MMNLNEFATYISSVAAAELGVKTNIIDVPKNNRTLKGLSIVREDPTLCPVVYVDDAFSEYSRQEKNLDDIIDELLERINIAKYNEPSLIFNPSFLYDFEKIRDDITIKLVGTNNTDYLQGKITVPCSEDLVGVVVIRKTTDDHAEIVAIPSDYPEVIGKTTDEIVKVAMDNLGKRKYQLPSFRNLLGGFIPPDEEDDLDEKRATLLLLDGESPDNYGAALILRTDIQEKISKIMDGDFYILPASIYELIIMPVEDDDAVRELNRIVMDVNNKAVAPHEKLGDFVQRYDSTLKRIVRA